MDNFPLVFHSFHIAGDKQWHTGRRDPSQDNRDDAASDGEKGIGRSGGDGFSQKGGEKRKIRFCVDKLSTFSTVVDRLSVDNLLVDAVDI